MDMVQKCAHPLSVDNSTVFMLSWVYTKPHRSFPVIQAPIMEQRAYAEAQILLRKLWLGESNLSRWRICFIF